MAGLTETLDPTLVIVDGESRLSRLVVSAAAERDDVEIAGVLLSPEDKIDPEIYNFLLAHDSVYGPLGKVATSVFCTMDARDFLVKASDRDVITVTQREGPAQFVRRHNLPPDFDSFGNILFTSTNDAWSKSVPYPLMSVLMEGAGGVDEGPQPHYVPDARVHALLPTLVSLNESYWLRSAHAVEVRSYTEENALADLGSQDPDLSRSRAAPTGSLKRQTQDDWRYLHGDLKPLLDTLDETSYTIPVLAGTRLVVSAKLQDRFNEDDIGSDLECLGFKLHEGIISSRDVVGSPHAAHVDLDSITIHGQQVKFELAYDSDWSRANRILDIARRIHANRTIQK